MTSPLTMTLFRPTGRLASYVRAFQVLTTAESARVSVLDFGGADVSLPVSFGDPVVVRDAGLAKVPSAAFVGPRTRSTWLHFDGSIDQINVSFLPGAAGAFVGVPLRELVGRVAPPDDVWPRSFREDVAELEPLPVRERVSRLADLLLAMLDERRDPGPQIREALRLVHTSRGRIQVRSLAGRVNLSVSQLERAFKRHVGMGPKLVARLTHASAVAAEAAGTPAVEWARLAYEYGYSDQAHLVRDFRELMGVTPSAFGRFGSDADFLQDALALPREE